MKKKICFVGLDAYPVLNPAKGTHYFGGESVQQTLLAKAFRDIGYDVSLLSLDYGQEDGELIEGITVYKTYFEGEGLPVLRFLYPKMTSILSALKKSDADVYFQSCAGMLTGIVAWFCQKHGKKFIFRLAHDNDCIPNELIINNWRDKKLYEYGLKRASLISAQGVRQKALMSKNYGLASTPVNMTVQLPTNSSGNTKDIDILWVNNIRQFKRPELVLELAKLVPHLCIAMIGGPVSGSEDLYTCLKEQASNIKNLNFLGAVPYHQVNSYFERSKIFANTSDSEGFPNSFLQAWIRGVPVVSFFDPDGLIDENHLGIIPTDISDMANSISKLLGNNEHLLAMGKASKLFAEENYSSVVVARLYETLLDSAI